MRKEITNKPFNKENLVPYVTGVQFRWQFDTTNEKCVEVRNEFDELSMNAIHIVTKDGKIINPIGGEYVSNLKDYNDSLQQVVPDVSDSQESAEEFYPEFDIVRVFNLAPTLAFGDCVPKVIYDITDSIDTIGVL